MNEKFQRIWKSAIPYLKKGKRKDFILHTKGVIKAMKLLVKREKRDSNILIPATMLHDTEWSKVPINLQKTNDKNKTKKAMKLHLKYSKPIINNILIKMGYDKKHIKKIIDIVLAHKFKNPKSLDKRLLIDADTLSDIFKEQFYGDCKAYNLNPKTLYKIRKNNKFYTKTAKIIFNKELEKRRKEIIKNA